VHASFTAGKPTQGNRAGKRFCRRDRRGEIFRPNKPNFQNLIFAANQRQGANRLRRLSAKLRTASDWLRRGVFSLRTLPKRPNIRPPGLRRRFSACDSLPDDCDGLSAACDAHPSLPNTQPALCDASVLNGDALSACGDDENPVLRGYFLPCARKKDFGDCV
jgi:hypothetical protein